ncbi:MAG: hypothetical protein PVH89_01335 [Gammaproteobacteria bacterium]|jgi:hypothetical protein
MSNYVKIAEETGDRYLSALEKGQESFLKYVTAVNQWAPRPAGAMAGVSLLRSISDAGFAFSEKLLQQQKAFSDMFVAEAATPAKPAPKPAGTSKAPTARKAKKSTSAAAAKAKTGSAAGGKPAQAAAKPTKAPAVRSSKKKSTTRTKATPAGEG